ncbi:MAG: SDR family oxidoreductase [Bdellovibrionales bacterium]|nr:SDR family oxidoreductase [Bdellovibrionales bacterium]
MQNPHSLVIVSGATGEIGKAIVNKLYSESYDILAIARNSDKLNELSAQTTANKIGKVFNYTLNDCNYASLAKKLEEFPFEKYENINLVNSMGLSWPLSNFSDLSHDSIDSLVHSNFTATLHIIKIFANALTKKEGNSIINIGSVAGRWSSPKTAIYNACKSAILSFSESIRHEFSSYGVRVTCIEPGVVDSQFSKKRFSSPEKAEYFYKGIPLLTPNDIANHVFWCIEQPKHVNIQELAVFPTRQSSVGSLKKTTDK